ncbi:MAG TPA: NADH-quinone oxidoreductase subunit M [Bacteroidota bacterium]|nr:NADH-quinone oxidoreductase subunit M [Bacteroidota bacterium]
MNFIDQHILTVVVFLPLAGALAVAFAPVTSDETIKRLGLAAVTVPFLLSLYLFFAFDSTKAGYQFVQHVPWIATLNISYFVGIDGISLLLVLLTTFLMPLALLGTWNSVDRRLREYTAVMLLLEAGMLGVFVSLDLFLFYVYWEAMLIPMYFIIGIWGGQERVYAAVKFFLYTLFGSLLMLVAILSLAYFASTQPGGQFTTNLLDLSLLADRIPPNLQLWMFAAFALSFAIKVPLFPLHTWLPDAHVQAPTAGSVILAGVLLKMGTYGFIRFCFPLFPDAAVRAAPILAVLSVVGIVYGALVAMVQTDMKKLVAYSSVSHLGFVVLGIFSMTEEGMQGAVIQMVNHGLSTGALFLLVGMIYDRTHTRMIADYGGAAKFIPVYATILMVVSLSSMGLPGLNGFVGEFLVLVGAFKSGILDSYAYAAVAGLGVIFSAVYLLWMYQRVMLGPGREGGMYGGHTLTDLAPREIAALVPIIVFIVWIGVYPSTFLSKSAPAVRNAVEQMENARRGIHVRYAQVSPVSSSSIAKAPQAMPKGRR